MNSCRSVGDGVSSNWSAAVVKISLLRVVGGLRTACESFDDADERIAPSLDVQDVAVAKLTVTKCLADRKHVEPNASLPHGDVRPDAIEQLPLCDHLTWAFGKIDQNIQR